MFRVFAQYFNPNIASPTYYFMTIFHFTFIAVHIRFFLFLVAICDPVFSSSKVYDLLVGCVQVKFGRLSFHFTTFLYLFPLSLGKNKTTITI